MKHVKDPNVTSLWDLKEGEWLTLSRTRIEQAFAPRMAQHCFAYAYLPLRKPEPYRFLGACLPDGMPENTQTVSIPLTQRAAPTETEPTAEPLPTPPTTETNTAEASNSEPEKAPEVPLPN